MRTRLQVSTALVATVLLATTELLLPVQALAQSFPSLSEGFERIHQVRKQYNAPDGVPTRESIAETNQLSQGSVRQAIDEGKTAEEIREMMEAEVVLQHTQPSTSEEEPEEEKQQEQRIISMSSHMPDEEMYRIIDDGDEGFSEQGHWDHFPIAGVLGDFHYIAGTNPIMAFIFKAKAAWNFGAMPNKEVDVYATWEAFDSLADDVVYNVNGVKVEVNQQEEPRDLEHEGHMWKYLTSVTSSTAENLVVTLNNDADGYVVADAVMIHVQDDTPPPSEESDLFMQLDVPQPILSKTGERITVIHAVENLGPDTPTNVVVTTTISEGMTFDYDGSYPPFCTTSDNRTITCKDIEVDTPFPLSFVVLQNPPCEAKFIATVSANEYDPDISNNIAGASSEIECTNDTSAKLSLRTLTQKPYNNYPVPNQKDITLMRFLATAEGEDIRLSKVVLTESSIYDQKDMLLNVGNHTLLVDTDNDGVADEVVEAGVAMKDGLVRFNIASNRIITVSAGEQLVLEWHADVAGSVDNTDTLQGVFATDVPVFIDAEIEANGTQLSTICVHNKGDPNCQILVDDEDSSEWRFVNAGNLYTDYTDVRFDSRQVLVGGISEPLLGVELDAEYEDIEVITIKIAVSGIPDSIDRLLLYTDASKDPGAWFARATTGACDEYHPTSFCAVMNSQELVIPANGDNTEVFIRAELKPDNAGGSHNEKFIVRIDDMEARGLTSSIDLLPYDNENGNTREGEIIQIADNIISEEHVSVLAKTVSIEDVNPDVDETKVLLNQRPIGMLKFTTTDNTSNAEVVYDKIVFTVDSNAITYNTAMFSLHNQAEGTHNRVTCLPKNAAGQLLTGNTIPPEPTFFVECTGLNDAPINTRVDNEESIVLVLEANIVAANEESMLQVSLNNFTTTDSESFGIRESHLEWIDTNGQESTNFFWIEHPETTINSTLYKN